MRRTLPIILLACLCVAPLSAISFSASDLDGNHVSQTIFAEKPLTMVFVWGTYCGYCIKEMPTLSKLQQSYPDLKVVGIAIDLQDSRGALSPSQVKKAKALLSKNSLDAVTLVPSSSLSSAFLQSLVGVPAAYFVDQSGNILSGPVYGMQTEKDLTATIKGYLR